MKAIHTKADPRQDVILEPIYMTREMWKQAVYIPSEIISKIIIVDFIEEENKQ